MGADSYDLVIVGAGSGNMLPASQFTGWRIAVVEADRFGGTCLHRGCILRRCSYMLRMSLEDRKAPAARSPRYAGGPPDRSPQHEPWPPPPAGVFETAFQQRFDIPPPEELNTGARLFTAGLYGLMAQCHLAPGSFSWDGAAVVLAGCPAPGEGDGASGPGRSS